MKLLIVSDLHERNIREVVPELVIEKADYIVSAGDYNCYPFPRPAVGVYGNHDDDSTEVFQNKTLINCHKKVVKVAGLTFLGVQGVFSPNPHKWYHQLESDVQDFLEKQPRVNVFITHERAAGIFDRMCSGSPTFRDYVLKKQPDYYVSGHVCANGTILRRGHTVCLNPHPCGAQRYIILEVETGNLKLVDVATHCWPEKRSQPSENKSAKRRC
jgi:Icc-related predicted phosphoesterase